MRVHKNKLVMELTKYSSGLKLFFLIFVTSLISHGLGVAQYKSFDIQNSKAQQQLELFIQGQKAKEENSKLKAYLDSKNPPQEIAQIAELKPLYLLIHRADGKVELRTGGNPAWRYNNPGKILYGDFAKKHGAIGNDGALAIFPDYATGKKAQEDWLFQEKNKDKNLKQAIEDYAPKGDGYDPKSFLEAVTKESGVAATTMMQDMTSEQRNAVLDAVQNYDTFIQGNVIIYQSPKQWMEEGYGVRK